MTEEEEPRRVAMSIPGSFAFLVGTCIGVAGPMWALAVIVWLSVLMLILVGSRGVTGVAFLIVPPGRRP